MSTKKQSVDFQRKLVRAANAVKTAGPLEMVRIFEAAEKQIREEIEEHEMDVMRHERFVDASIPIHLGDTEPRVERLEKSKRWLADARRRLMFTMEIVEVFRQLEHEQSAMDLVDYLINVRKKEA